MATPPDDFAAVKAVHNALVAVGEAYAHGIEDAENKSRMRIGGLMSQRDAVQTAMSSQRESLEATIGELRAMVGALGDENKKLHELVDRQATELASLRPPPATS